jgi:ABC-2 type transport system ATP-binding protein
VAGDATAVADACGRLDAVSSADVDGGGVICALSGAAANLSALLATAAGAGATVTSVEVRGADLETVFLHLTGKALRD